MTHTAKVRKAFKHDSTVSRKEYRAMIVICKKWDEDDRERI